MEKERDDGKSNEEEKEKARLMIGGEKHGALMERKSLVR